jgi:protein TonB
LGVPGSTGAVNAASGLINQLIGVLPAAAPPAPKAKETAPPDRPVTVSGGVQAAKLIRKVIPQYPTLARQARLCGTVRLVGIIAKDGSIKNLQLVSGPPMLVQAAFDAVKQWMYRPTLLSDEPVEVIAPIEVVFTLNR